MALCFMFPLDSRWLKEDKSTFKTSTKSLLPKILPRENSQFVILAPSNSGKTSLLFQSAVSFASKGVDVCYISKEPLKRMPLGVHGMPKPDASVLKTVRFLYMSHVDELVNYCSTIHTKTLLPEIILIDDFDLYVHQLKDTSVEQGCARLCAQLVDAQDFINHKTNYSPSCKLILTFTERQNVNTLQSVFNKFAFTVASVEDGADSSYSLSLKMKTSMLKISYQIGNNEVFLQDVEITEHG